MFDLWSTKDQDSFTVCVYLMHLIFVLFQLTLIDLSLQIQYQFVCENVLRAYEDMEFLTFFPPVLPSY